jgi:tight adherence protein B
VVVNPIVPAVLVFIAVAFATVAVVLVLEAVRAWVRRRSVARRVDQLMATGDVAPDAERRELFRRNEEKPTVLDALIARSGRLQGLPVLLEHSGVGWTTGTFALLTAGGAVAGGLFGWVARGGILVPAVLAVALGWLPYLYVSWRKKRRLARFEEIFPESVDMLGRAIRAGHPLSAGIQMVGQEMAEPVAAEFRTIFEEQRFGVPFADALMGLVDRVDLVDVRIFATAVLVQREVGGNLAEILDNISHTIRARFKIRRQLRTFTAQGRMSGVVVGSMPIVVGLAFYAINPEYILTLFEHPVGRIMLAFGFTMQIFGYLWIRRIVNIEI